MKRFSLILSIIFLLIGITANSAFSQEELSDWDSKERIENLKEQLDLTDEQSDKIISHWKIKEEEASDFRNKMKEQKNQLAILLNTMEQPNKDAGFKIIEEIGNIKTELYKLNFSFLVNLKTMLTPEQWEQLKSTNNKPNQIPKIKKPKEKIKRKFREKD